MNPRYSRSSSRPAASDGNVRAKKALGQHFLKDENIARQIADSLTGLTPHVLEIGPGMGVLTKYLYNREGIDFHAIEIDNESVRYLHDHYPQLHVIEGDFLALDPATLFSQPFAVIGNFPYNISSQILFKVFDNRNRVPEVVGMFQKEVAERVAAKPGSKTYGILSVLLSAFYDIEYLFQDWLQPAAQNPPQCSAAAQPAPRSCAGAVPLPPRRAALRQRLYNINEIIILTLCLF